VGIRRGLNIVRQNHNRGKHVKENSVRRHALLRRFVSVC
jgi:hypothetical protein